MKKPKMTQKQKVARDKKQFRIWLNKHGYSSYPDYLQSDHWQEFKETYRNCGRLCECVACGNPKYELHHTSYRRIGREWPQNVIPVCRIHHQAIHDIAKEMEVQLKKSLHILAALTDQNSDYLKSKLEHYAFNKAGTQRKGICHRGCKEKAQRAKEEKEKINGTDNY